MNVNRIALAAAFLFPVLFVVGLLLVSDQPAGGDSDQEITNFYASDGNQVRLIVGAYLMVLSGLAFLSLITFGIEDRVTNGGEIGRRVRPLLLSSAALAAACFAIGSIALATIGAVVAFDDAVVDPGTARFMQGLGFGTVLIAGALSAAFTIAVASVEALLHGSLPRWLSWLGIVCAVVLCFGVIFLPMIALPIWSLAFGIWLLTHMSEAPRAAPQAPQPA